MQTWFKGCFLANGNHVPIGPGTYKQHKGNFFSLFRSPYKLAPSQYLRDSRHPGTLSTPYTGIDFTKPQAQQSLLHWHKGVQVSWLAGGKSSQHVEDAIRMIKEGFRFVGITDEWADTVCLFHRMLMNDAPCLAVEFVNNRPTSTVPGTQAMNASVGTEFLHRSGWVDEIDGPFFDAVQRLFNQRKQVYGVTAAACMAIKCSTHAWTAAELDTGL